MLREDFFDDPESTNGGVYNSYNLASYSFSYNNPTKYIDPDGECPNCATAAAGAIIGGIIGGAIEAGTQLYRNGKVDNWRAVGGAALQGAIVGGAAGFTGGASLLATAGVSGGANIVGGTVNRAIQGQKTTLSDVAIDGTVGAVLGAGGKLVGNSVKNVTNNLSRSAKGILGEAISEIKYGAKGFVSAGKAEVLTGGKTPTGRLAKALFDHDMENIFTGKKIIVESKFNTSGLTNNQSAAINKGANVIIDRTTSQGLGNLAKTTTIGAGGGVAAQTNKKVLNMSDNFEISEKVLLTKRNNIFKDYGILELENNGYFKSPFKTAWFGEYDSNISGYSYELCKLTNQNHLHIITVSIVKRDKWIKIFLNIFELSEKLHSLTELKDCEGINYYLPPNDITKMRLRGDDYKGPPIFRMLFLPEHKIRKYKTQVDFEKALKKLRELIKQDMINIDSFVKRWYELHKPNITDWEGNVIKNENFKY